jgi:hypothetical protein
VRLPHKPYRNAKGSDNKILKLKWGGIHVKMRGDLTAVTWRDMQEMYTYRKISINHQHKTIYVINM